jgi:hypothetical protein
MKALISPMQNDAVVQVVADDKVFDVAEPLYWQECPSIVTAYEFAYKNLEYIHYTPASEVPTVVTMRQARLALLQEGLLAIVDVEIAQGEKADQISWEYATEVSRYDPMVKNLGVALNLSEEQLDELFLLAATI